MLNRYRYLADEISASSGGLVPGDLDLIRSLDLTDGSHLDWQRDCERGKH